MIAVTSTSASGVALPPAATIGPKVVASENAGPIEAAERTSKSGSPRTRRIRLSIAQELVTVSIERVYRNPDREPHDETNPRYGAQPRHEVHAQDRAEG